MRPFPRTLLASCVLGLVLAAGPAAAQYRELVPKETPPGEKPPPPPKTDAQDVEEVIVTPRNVPSYEEYDAYQREEFEKIRARFEKPPPAEPRGDQAMEGQAFEQPQDRSDVRAMMREGPRLRDLGEE